MSKKSQKPKRKPGGHLSSVPSVPKMPLQLVMNQRVVDSLTPEFVRWFEGFGEAPDALHCLQLVKLIISAGHALHGESSATQFTLDGLEEAALALADNVHPDESDEALDGFYDELHLYVDFLMESGRWTGSREDYDEVHGFLSGEADDDLPDLPDIQVPELSDAEQDHAFSELPLIQRTTRLLDWVGAGKEVTSTGALRLKDIEAAAAAVSIEAKGKKNAKRPFEAWEGDEAHLSAVLEVGSMHDVPVLREIWIALFQSGILSLGATRAVPGEEAGTWNSKDTAARNRIRQIFLTAFLVDALTTPGGPWSTGPELDSMLAMVLVQGGSAEPMEVAELASLADTGAGGDIVRGFAAMRARTKLANLAELGLVAAGTHYTVPPVVIGGVPPAIALVLMEVDGDFEPEEFATAAAPPSNVIQMRAPKPASH
ncbi:hypothetical protein [Arthrobacter sp. CJ23]|uniref:hypothetical protein n=1 Tax=Arthrobacter sp. CJ23 TaxID=2972479 RepID=UPI00215CEA88|nr:hypothetical protein [Arthrobacter sp. CJ23]UVJ40227.1 hypothetical protein NVV90_03295 [Arthrobacter sp. CJ23]